MDMGANNDPSSPLHTMPGGDRLLFAPYAPPHEAIFLVRLEMQRVHSRPFDATLKIVEYSLAPSDENIDSA